MTKQISPLDNRRVPREKVPLIIPLHTTPTPDNPPSQTISIHINSPSDISFYQKFYIVLGELLSRGEESRGTIEEWLHLVHSLISQAERHN